MSLRSKLIRLANQRPEFRDDLLPLLGRPRLAFEYNKTKTDKIRISWNNNALLIEELPEKPVKRKLRRSQLFTEPEVVNQRDGYLIGNILRSAGVHESLTYDQAVSLLKRRLQDLEVEYDSEHPPQVRETIVHHLDVVPRDLDPITVQGKDFLVDASWLEFRTRHPNDVEYFEKIVSRSKEDAKRFYRMVKSDPTALQTYHYSELVKFLESKEIYVDLEHGVY